MMREGTQCAIYGVYSINRESDAVDLHHKSKYIRRITGKMAIPATLSQTFDNDRLLRYEAN